MRFDIISFFLGCFTLAILMPGLSLIAQFYRHVAGIKRDPKTSPEYLSGYLDGLLAHVKKERARLR